MAGSGVCASGINCRDSSWRDRQSHVEDRPGGRAGIVIAEYAIQGNKLTPKTMRVYLQNEPAPDTLCELYLAPQRHQKTR
jgi:hypothetical protein